MTIFRGFAKGFTNCFKAFSIIFDKGLWPFLIYPLLLWIATLVLSLLGMALLADYLSDWINGYLQWDSIPEAGHWLSFARPFLMAKTGFLVAWVIKILFWFVSSIFSKYLLLILLSPLFALLSEKADEKLTGQSFPFSIGQLLKDIGRGIVISLRNMLLEYFFTFVSAIATLFFAPLGLVAAVFLPLLSAYYVGFAMLDYNCERYRYGVGKSISLIKANKGYAIGIGLVYNLFMLLPFFIGDLIGLMFGPALAVVGATISFIEIKKRMEEQNNLLNS